MSRPEVTVGIDIGTTSVKALAADEDGNVVARSRVPHEIRDPRGGPVRSTTPTRAWRGGPRAALDALGARRRAGRGERVRDGAVAHRGRRRRGAATPGLLYGDGAAGGERASSGNPVESGELVAFLRWTREQAPGRRRVLARDRGGEPRARRRGGARHVDRVDRVPAVRLERGGTRRSRASSASTVEQLPRLVPTGWECGRVGGADGPVLASGCIDVLADQIVAGADNDGDVLVLLGTTLS